MGFEINILDLITTILISAGAIFSYFKFFREGSHKQRIEFDLELNDLGVVSDQRLIEIGILAENKGNVEQRFQQIELKVRGLPSNSELNELANFEPRIEFPISLHKIKLVNETEEYYFVRPRIVQRFPVTVKIPDSISHLLVKARFDYKNGEFHSAERTFKTKQ